MTAAELQRLAEDVGLDVVGSAPATAYAETEEHIRERRARGLFAGVSLEGARLAPDEKSNRSFYGAAVVPESLLFSHRAPKQPAASLEFRGALP